MRFIWKARFRKFNGIESDSKYHSPILGFAYDGNPIYGPPHIHPRLWWIL